MGTDGALVSEWPAQGYAPSWSPAGTEILYNAAQPSGDWGALWFYDVTTKASHPLIEDFGGGSIEWQPQGSA